MKLVNKATGGILFIDEAYSLTSDKNDKRDFGVRAIDVIVNQMDIHKNDVCFIFAGYTKEMSEFLEANPGLESRIPFKIHFEDYSNQELITIFINQLRQHHFEISEPYYDLLDSYFDRCKNNKNFGNARTVRNLTERVLIEQACRMLDEGSNDMSIRRIDIKNSIEQIENNYIGRIEKKHNRIGFSTTDF